MSTRFCCIHRPLDEQALRKLVEKCGYNDVSLDRFFSKGILTSATISFSICKLQDAVDLYKEKVISVIETLPKELENVVNNAKKSVLNSDSIGACFTISIPLTKGEEKKDLMIMVHMTKK